MLRLTMYCGVVLFAASPVFVSRIGGAAEKRVADFFQEAPPDCLARHLREVTGSPVAAGKRVPASRGSYRWDAERRCMVVEFRPASAGTPVNSADWIDVIDWTVRGADIQDGARYRPLTYRTDTWYGSTFWTGPDWTRVGRDWHHSGNETPSVRRFMVPRDGRITIRGRCYKADTKSGDGVHVEIRHGARRVWQADIGHDDSRGVEPQLALSVREGDAIRFVVQKGRTITCDTTHWDPVVTYEDETVFQASTGFAAHRQGAGGWYYEMDISAGERGTVTGPMVYGFNRDLRLYERVVAPREPAILDASEVLPAWIVADASKRSGIVLAWLGSAPCRLACRQSADGQLRIQIGRRIDHETAKPADAALPQLVVAAYQGPWLEGMAVLQRLISSVATLPGADVLRHKISSAAQRTGIPTIGQSLPELDLCAMVQRDWRSQDQLSDDGTSYSEYSEAVQRHLKQARRLLADLPQDRRANADSSLARTLSRLDQASRQAKNSLPEWKTLYQRTRWLKRKIMLANPVLDFGKLLFCKRVPTSYSHEVMQYYGWRARPGGGLFQLDRPGYSLACHDLLDGRLASGNTLEPRLSYDGRRIVFSYVDCRTDGQAWDPARVDNEVDEGFYHIWSVKSDGTGLKQLTRGPFDDLMPAWLPDGGIVFSSTRRRGYARCFGAQFSRRWHVYALHRMCADGSQLRALSAHDTNEWFPTVSNSGHVLYSRWDYIDRDAVTHQNLWAMHPDGTNPVSVWGNATSAPHCSFQAQPIPGSQKIVFTASAHHSITAGSIAILDPARGDNGQAAITRLTPEVPFPEAEGRNIREYYASPWPLSEELFLVAYSPTPLIWEPGANQPNALGIYLLDSRGNRELIYRDPQIGSTNPCPLVARPKPPQLKSLLPPGSSATGEMTLIDVYQGLGQVARGTIKELRIIQILPKTTPVADQPRVGLAREENARAILGTVPVYPDGSARFLVPAMKPILFQALDQDGFAYQTMRTVTYVQPGERISCYGCHESRRSSPATRVAMATRLPPSDIDPGPFGGRPFSFMEVVQPVLDKHCVTCHGPQKLDGNIDLTSIPKDGFTRSYWALCGGRDFWGAGTNPENAAQSLVPRFGGRNQVQITPPGGIYGARGSRLLQLLRAGHYQVRLNADDLRRLAAWIDCNAIFYGVYLPQDQARQLRGEPVGMPKIQ